MFRKKPQYRRFYRVHNDCIEVVLVDHLGQHDVFWDSDQIWRYGWELINDKAYKQLIKTSKLHIHYSSPSRPGFE